MAKQHAWSFLLVAVLPLAIPRSTLAVGRLLLIPLGTDPNTAIPGTQFPVTVGEYPDDYTLTVAVYVDAEPNEEILAVQAIFPCGTACSGGGAITFIGGSETVDYTRTDDLAEGHFGLIFPVTDPGMCPVSGPIVALGMSSPHFHPPLLQTDIRYVGHVQYSVSYDCVGTANLKLQLFAEVGSSATFILDDQFNQIPFSEDGFRVTVQDGKCCSGMNCLGEISPGVCADAGGVSNLQQDCFDPCCAHYADCADIDVCTFDSCDSASCTRTAVQYGNVDGLAGVNLDDVICAMHGFWSFEDCPNADLHPSCTGDGSIDVFDLIKVTNAFRGSDPCGCSP